MNTSANIITTMGIISGEVYDDKGENYFIDEFNLDGSKKIKTIKGTTYEVVTSTGYNDITGDSSWSGIQALLLEETKKQADGTFVGTGDYVIAFRGTDSLMDVIVDVLAATANINLQYDNAVQFVKDVIKDYGIDKSNLTLTGHSLGGILTQQVGASQGIKGYAYNPWGADALTKYPPNGPLNIVARILDAVGIYSSSAEAFAKDNIANISYQDGGNLNGDFLSNLATGLVSQHLGDAFIPIWGADIGADGHSMPILNNAIAHYNTLLNYHFTNSSYEELSLAYLSTGGYERAEQIFTDLDIYNHSGLTFDILTYKPTSALQSKSIPNIYALQHLNPFAIEGNLPAYSDINPDDYSDQYMKDRAEFLSEFIHDIGDWNRNVNVVVGHGGEVVIVDNVNLQGYRNLVGTELRIAS